MAGIRCGIVASFAVVFLAPAVRAQVAFQPIVGSLPSGPSLGVTPSISIDRRYVRLGVNAQFIGDVGFNTILVPGAVGGGPGGPGALGGIGLGLGGGGGGGAGGGRVLAGMDGVIDPTQGIGLGGVTPGYGYGYNGYPSTAGAAPAASGAMPAATTVVRSAPPRSNASKALRRANNPRQKGKHPASAVPR
jgi:hypothetical protein